jgi:hypothetical protein
MVTFRRLARPSVGIKPKLMQQLYKAVAILKMTYTVYSCKELCSAGNLCVFR